MLENDDIFQLVGIVAISVTYLLTVIFNAVNGIGGASIFYNTVGSLSDKYPLDITPDGWAFSIWGLIYLWLGLSVVFFVISLFKKNSDGLKLYMNPPVIDLIFSFTLTLNLTLNITWIFTWDREQIVTSCAVLIFMALTNLVAVGNLARNLASNDHELLKSNNKLYWTYVSVMNGLALYTTWTVIASLLNLGHALHYVSEVSMQDTSNICLSFLLIFSLVYFLTENSVLDKYLRFLATPYLVLIWALTAIVTKESTDPNILDQTKMFVAALLSISCILFVLRMLLIVIRQMQNPIGKVYDTMDSGKITSTTYGSIF